MKLHNLSLRERAAQLMFPRLGSNMPPPVTVAEDIERFEDLLDACPVGGLIVFNGSYPRTTEVLSRLQSQASIPLLVSADMERGVGQQIRGATVFPHARAFSAAGNEKLMETAARVQAREALACGIHITFSPVADVNRDPRNPIIATRAFGADPHEAARFVQAFIRGAKTEGVITTAKHFPGHGNTSQDSHAEVPIVKSSREDLEAFDLVPFRAAIEAGVDLIMSAHVVFPAIDPDRPATLSPTILRELLRDELGFEGGVITDSLLMGAIKASHPEPGEQAVALVEAGVDILLDVSDPVAAVDGIVAAVERGSLDSHLVDEAAERVLALKRRLVGRIGGALFSSPSSVFGSEEVGSLANGEVAERAAREAVTVVDDRRDALPIGGEKVLAILIKPHRTRLDPEVEPFGSAFERAFPRGSYRQLDPRATDQEFDEVRRLASESDLVVLALVVKPAAWHAFGLLPEQQRLAEELVADKPVVVISLGSPYVLEDFPNASARLCTYSDVSVSQTGVVDVLSGKISSTHLKATNELKT